MKIFLILSIICFLPMGAGAIDSGYFKSQEQSSSQVSAALNLAEKGQWKEALAKANQSGNKSIKSLVLWLKYQASPDKAGYGFAEISQFINQHAKWPVQSALIANAEKLLSNGQPADVVLAWYKNRVPISGAGAAALAEAKYASIDQRDTQQMQNITELVKMAWAKGNFDQEKEELFLRKFANLLKHSDHIKRIDMLLWEHNITPAKRIMKLVDDNHRRLFNARIELIQNPAKVSVAMNMVPAELRTDPGLLYELASIYDKRKDYDKVRKLLVKMHENGVTHSKIWDVRIKQIRELIQEKKYQAAYDLAKKHNTKNSSDYADAEWMAGWLSLRFLGDDIAAYKHFYNLYKNVKYPISLARGAYWSGRANEKRDPENAAKWYKLGAEYPDTFYGQLSLLKVGDNIIQHPASGVIPTEQDVKSYKNNELIKISYLLAKAGKVSLAKSFTKAAVEHANSPGEIALISEFGMKTLNNVHLSVETAKHAAREKAQPTAAGYPNITKMPASELEKALILSIIRQESVFDHKAESSAGAMGLMQVMPATAKIVAKDLAVKFHKTNLKADYLYNIKIGSHHLKKNIQGYDGSYVLAIAAYNAGPGNVQKWLKTFNDPRNFNNIEQVVDWIEMIPFFETRNYVQRVLENLQIYRAVTAGKGQKQVPLLLDKDLLR